VPDNDYRLQLAADLSQLERGLARITNQLAGVVGGLNETDAGLKKTATSSKTAGDGMNKFSTSLNSTRYALYDVSRTMLVAGAALVAFGLAPTKVAIDFQREFASVQRTVSGAGQDIKDQLKDLSTQIPVAFKNLTEIATLGGQLGIGKEGIVQFTETVAKLTATTNLTADVAGTALGRFQSFGLVTSAQFEKLASAILKVGVNSVATESQIVTIATRIAGIGKLAGLNAQTLVGFAGALASVGVQSYAASGSTIRLIQKMQDAVTNGGSKLETFAKVAGVSTDEFKKAFGTEKFNPIFQSFVENLGNVQRAGGNVNDILDKLSLSGAIDSRTFSQLAAASGTVAQSFKDANTGFQSAKTLNEQYGRVAETTASKITELGNSIMNLLDTIGSQTTGPLAGFVSMLTDAAKALSQFLSTPTGQNFAIIATGIALVSGALLLLSSIAARGAASLIGMVTAIKGLGAESIRSTGFLAALNAELAASGPLGQKAAVGLNAVSIAMKAVTGLFVVGTISAGIGDLVDQFNKWTGQRQEADQMTKTLDKAGNSYKKLIDSVVNAKGAFNLGSGMLGVGNAASSSRQFSWFYDILEKVNSFSGGQKLASQFDTTGILKFRDEIKQLDQALAGEATKNPAQAAIQYKYLSDALKDAGYSSKEIAAIIPQSTKALAEHKTEVDKATKALEQYADQSGVSASFIERLSAATGLDAKGIDKWVEGYQKSVAPLTDFNNIVKQVQTGLEAAAEAQAKSIGGDSKASDFYDGQSVSLQQFTDQLNANNQAQLTWAQNLVTISATYGPQAAQPFIDAGYSAVTSSVLQQLVNATPEQAQAYIAAQQQAADLASAAMAQRILASGYVVTEAGGQIGMDTAKKMADLLGLGVGFPEALAQLQLKLTSDPLVPKVNTEPAKNQILSLTQIPYPDVVIGVRVNLLTNIQRAVNNAQIQANQYASGNAYASGGLVRGRGTGTSDSIPARISNGEYIIKASRVRQLGVGYLDALNGGRSVAPGHFADGGPVSGGGMGITELGPMSLRRLESAVRNQVDVYLGDEHIARSSNRGNARMASRGAD